jgi:hypothetical protein
MIFIFGPDEASNISDLRSPETRSALQLGVEEKGGTGAEAEGGSPATLTRKQTPPISFLACRLIQARHFLGDRSRFPFQFFFQERRGPQVADIPLEFKYFSPTRNAQIFFLFPAFSSRDASEETRPSEKKKSPFSKNTPSSEIKGLAFSVPK